MNRMRTLAGAVVLMTVWSIALAEEVPNGRQAGKGYADQADQDGRSRPPSREKREEVRKKIEAIRIYRLTETLNLDEKTSAKVASLIGSIDRKRRELTDESQTALRDLRAALKAVRPDESKIKSILDKIERSDRETADLRQREFQGLKDILTIEQQARYVIFQRDFMREMRSMIAGARGKPGMGPGSARDEEPGPPK